MGGYKIASLTGAHYFLTIVDDFSRATWVYLLKYKSDAQRYILMFCKMIERQFGAKVKCIQSDNGSEFRTQELMSHYENEGIIFQTSCTDTPQQNGVVERKHRHLLETARALRFRAGLPLHFWGECVLTAAYLINRMPIKPIQNKTPFEILLKKRPQYHHLRIFGCMAYAKDTHKGIHKFAERGRPCIFLGYPATQKGYKVYDLKQQKLIVSRDVVFLEDNFPYLDKEFGTKQTHTPQNISQHNFPSFVDDEIPSTRTATQDLAMDEQMMDYMQKERPIEEAHADESFLTTEDVAINPAIRESSSPANGTKIQEIVPQVTGGTEIQEEIPQVIGPSRRSQRERKQPKHLKDFQVDLPPSLAKKHGSSNLVKYPLSHYVTYNNFSPSHSAFLAAITNNEEPKYFHQAVKHTHWRDAMQKEITALEANGTWTLEYLPPGKRAIDSKWVYKIKYKPDGTIERYKARLVAKGFTQVEGIDYHDTFAPVAKLVTVRCLIALAASKGWHLHQLDVNNAFLHGDLEEEVYMKIPQGFAKSGDDRVCRLRKSLYGLRQASRNWYTKFTNALLKINFTQSCADHSLFIHRTGDVFVAALIYVDDVLLTGNDLELMQRIKQFLDHQFSIKDLGPLKYFLGIEVARTRDGIVLSQRKYVLDILEDSGMQGARPSLFPIEQHHQLTQPTSKVAPNPASYRRLVGRLLYLTITRPDITYAVNTLSQFVHSPSPSHVDAANRVLRYLKCTPGQGIFFPFQNSLNIEAFCDADWGGCQTTRRSTTGYFIRLGSAPISWRTKKQSVVARSSAEAEYRAMASTVSELIWLRCLLQELGVSICEPTILHCDNQAALHIAANPVFHERTKHVEMDCHFVRERVASKEIQPRKISSNEQIADLFTKGLAKNRFHYLLSKLSIRDLHASA